MEVHLFVEKDVGTVAELSSDAALHCQSRLTALLQTRYAQMDGSTFVKVSYSKGA
jgi:hypothetical protein